MAQVACTSTDCDIVGFDAWIARYAEVDNPGPESVFAEMLRLGHRGKLELISGGSRDTVPWYLKPRPNLRFDLVTVDGDHSEEGGFRATCGTWRPWIAAEESWFSTI